MSSPQLGAIADDFTGATDLADQLVAGGMRTLLVIGTPADALPSDVDAIVIALKTRTIDPAQAVQQSLDALALLERVEVAQVFFKYCSTFDSTDRGNIGPVGDALAERLGQHVTVFCPAYPANGRTIYRGYLFVGDVLLSESGMRNHPLTPMHDANLVRVLGQQSTRRVGLVGLDRVQRGPAAIVAALAELGAEGPAHAIVDITSDDALLALGDAVADERLVTGGAGIALGLAAAYRAQGRIGEPSDAVAIPVRGGRAAVLAGSASVATRAQVAHYRASGAPCFALESTHLADPPVAIDAVLAWAREQRDATPLIAATAEPDEVRRNQEHYGVIDAGARVEAILAGVASGLVAEGVCRLVVAGGETSGAIVGALGVTRLRVGPRIDVGVPWTIADTAEPLGLALKSGNFGREDFFTRALALTS